MLRGRRLPSWMLVAIGVLLNVVSALLVYLVVERNMQEIMTYDSKLQTTDKRIDSIWQNYLRLEQQEGLLLTLLLSANPGSQMEQAKVYIRSQIAALAEKHDLQPLPDELPDNRSMVAGLREIIGSAQKNTLQDIDETYLEKVRVEEIRRNLYADNERWHTLALFLQLIGLILVLARDLTKVTLLCRPLKSANCRRSLSRSAGWQYCCIRYSR